ncbi:MAG: hypothetical protein ACQETB_10030 [Halobacteriota archaeon]
MDPEKLRSMLETNGELMVKVAEFDETIELHLHDTDIGDDTVSVQLTDGTLEFDVAAVSGAWQHTHSLEDFGLE